MEEIKKKIKEHTDILIVKIKAVGVFFKREANETKIAAKILVKMSKGEEVTPEQIKFLKEQSIDFGKALAIVGLQAIPGSSVGIIALEKLGQKHGFTVFPTDQQEPEFKEDNKEDEKP